MSDALRLADAETRRFGLRIARGGATAAADPLALLDAMLAQRIDIAILRVDAADPGAVARLARTGLAPLHADTLSTWGHDLARAPAPRLLPGGGALRAATASDAEAIARLVRRVFADYPNHYRANPLLDPVAAVEGYVEWALSHVDAADRCGWVHVDGDTVAGLACAAHEAGAASGNLHGVDPAHGRRGIYVAMIEATIAHFAALGLRELRISTQAGNLAVQRVWARLGLRPVRAEHTCHLSPMVGLALAEAGVAADPAHAVHDALVRAHAAAFGDAALSDLHLRVVRTDATADRIHRAAARRHDGGRRCTTLALDRDRRIAGWAVTDRIA